MELVETRNNTVNSGEATVIRDTLKELVEKNPSGGEITLNELSKKVGKEISRSEIVRALKKAQNGVFITGRRGRHSRFVFGPSAVPFIARIQAAQKKQAQAPEKTQTEPTAQNAASFELRVKVGDQTTTIPIGIELALA